MVRVGARKLKAGLSGYLKKARSGERIVVTLRGEEIAELGPLSPDRRAVNALVAEGKAAWKGGKPRGTKGIETRGGPLSDTVIEERR